ncbi:MAG: molybdopterin-dependent oxidoreductase [Bacteroidales bacterium]|nr:molybdopterin-dependent oxidoreductase [Bacteroidales bacterium]
MKKITRRKFIKISAAGTAGLALSGMLLNATPKLADYFDDEPLDESEAEKTATYCEVCFWKCAGWVYKNKKGNIQKILGNHDDPNSNGRFCPRGTGGVGFYYDEDRLKKPMIRVGEGENASFKEVEWDEALDLIAKRLGEITKQHGGESVALFTHGSGGTYWGQLLQSIGSTSIAAPSYAQCRGPREVGFIATFGEGVNSPEPTDIENTKCMVLIGSHIGENMHNGQVQEMSKLIDRGATIITVDPRFSTAASKSKFWLPIKPATDLALLLAWIHIIIYEDLYDKDYIEQYAFGFDQLKAHVKNFTPEWAEGITTLRADDIRKTAHEMHEASPAVIIHPGRHVTWYGDDSQRLRAVAILNALLGSWGRKGGFYFPEKMKAPSLPHAPVPKPNKVWKEALKGKYTLAGLALASGICDATIPDNTGQQDFKAWIVNGTNLIKTLPNEANTIKAIDALEFMVVVDTMPSDITGYADVVLPECTYLERWDLPRFSQHRIPSVALRMPAAEPKYDSKPAWWMAKQVGIKMGLSSCYEYDTFEEAIDWQLKQVGTSLEEMKRIGVKQFKRTKPMYLVDGQEYHFKTPTGKIELYSNAMAAEGFDPMPIFTAHAEPDPGFYRLIYGRAPMHTFSRSQNNPNLSDLMNENNVWVNPIIATQLGLKNDQEVWLENQHGIVSSFPIKVRVTERIRHDSVYMVHGFGHKKKQMSRAYGKGASDTELITNVKYDPVMGGTGMRENFVKFHTEKPEIKEVES